MKNNILICFTGIDGSGKSTLAKLLHKKLKVSNRHSKIVYGRYVPFFTRPLLFFGNYFFFRNIQVQEHKKYCQQKQSIANKHFFLIQIYNQLIFLEYSIQFFFKITLPKFFNYTIICDRYVYDTIINDIIKDNNSIITINNLLDNFFNTYPKPDFVFLIDISENIAFSRKTDTPSLDYLIEKRMIYLQLGERYGMVILDGQKTLEELVNDIYLKIS